jgi:tRNA uracil 4-sulfurtransferase
VKGVLLLSGGIDSPVAGYLMLRQGVDMVAVHMDARPHSDEAGLQKARMLAKKMGEAAGKVVPLNVVPYGRFHEEAARLCRMKLHCIFCKRFMYRVAGEIAKREGADFIVTGESLGQVASQTLNNIMVLDETAKVPVIRPLIGFDKEDTIAIAREIGTFELSSMKSGGCPFVPESPSTMAKLGEVVEEESKVDMKGLVDESLSKAEVA